MKKLRPFLITLVLLAVIVYVPFVKNQLVWDDEQFIYNNSFVRHFSVKEIFTENTIAGAGEISNYYRPLTTLSFAWDFAFWGTNPIGFHLKNLLLHTSAGVLLFLLLRQLGLHTNTAWWIAAAFLVHPVQTEAVTYANSRGDSLYAVWGLCSLLSFVLVLQAKRISYSVYNHRITGNRFFWSILVVICYLLSILSKEIGIAVLGLHVLLYLTHQLRSKQSSGSWFAVNRVSHLVLINLFLISAIYLALRATALNFSNSFNFYGDTNSEYTQHMSIRLLTFTKILIIYLQILLIPFPLHMERSTSIVQSLWQPWLWIVAMLGMILLWTGWYEWRTNRSTWIWLGTGWFICMLAPVSGIIPINGLLYEHWLYLPMVGIGLICAGLLRLIPFSIPQWLGYILLSFWILLAWRQNFIWSTPERLYSHILKYSSTARVHNNLAMAYAAQGKHELALQEYQAALRISDHYPQIYHNMANTYGAQKKWDEAITHYQKAIDLAPQFEPAYFRLLLVHVQLEQWNQAEEVLQAWYAVAGDTPDIQQASEFLTAQKTLRKSTE